MIGYVYLTVNDITNVVYVGKRQKPKFEKWYKGSGTHLKQALKKYGRENFFTYLLEKCNTIQDLNNSEKKWISIFKSCGVEMYNIAPGGDGGNIVDWNSLPAERRQIINQKNRDAHIGEKNGFFGKKHSTETRKHLHDIMVSQNRVAPKELLAYKRNQREKLPEIVQIDRKSGETIKVWGNWCEAGKYINPNNRLTYTHISECCKGKRKSAYGYLWALSNVGVSI